MLKGGGLSGWSPETFLAAALYKRQKLHSPQGNLKMKTVSFLLHFRTVSVTPYLLM